ncbi:hypothetical protein [Nocardia sp. NPDC057440]|uniref:hypothetical protein n=1 Tax=Nocardia sp. NPDC057440 TaxID=3346134 RepID=UPI00366BC8D4
MAPEPLIGLVRTLRDLTDRLLHKAVGGIVDDNYRPAIGKVKSSVGNTEMADWRSGQAVLVSGVHSGLHDSDIPEIPGEIMLGPWPGEIVHTENVSFDVDGQRVPLTLEGDDLGRWRVQQPDRSVEPQPTLHYNMTYYLKYLVEDSPEQLVREISAKLPALPDVPAARLDLARLLEQASAAPGGIKLVVGGGHSFRSPKPGEVFVNNDPGAFPDLLADVGNLWMIPDASVDQVFFDRVGPYDALAKDEASAPAEISRILKPEGLLTVRGGFPAYNAAKEVIETNLTEAGLQNVKLRHPWSNRSAAILTANKPMDEI